MLPGAADDGSGDAHSVAGVAQIVPSAGGGSDTPHTTPGPVTRFGA
ncbi:hypothetical protein ACPXCG_19820 [Gordonia sp. DT218]